LLHIELHELDAERNVLRKLLDDEKFLQDVSISSLIVKDHFVDLFHRDIFNTLVGYYKNYGHMPDLKKLQAHIPKHISYTSSFKNKETQLKLWKSACEKLFHGYNGKLLKADIDSLEEMRKARLVQSTLVESFRNFKDGKYDDSFSIMASNLAKSQLSENRIMEGDLYSDEYQHKNLMSMQKKGLIAPVPSGIFGAKEDSEGNGTIVELDHSLDGGFYQSDLAIIVGDTNLGKSFFLMECAYSASIKKKNAIVFTIEMNKIKAQRRMYSRLTNIPFWKFKTAQLNEKEEVFWHSRLEQWKEKCGMIYVVSFDKGATVQDIESKMVETQGRLQLEWDVCVIDYLNDMNPVGKFQNTWSWDAMGDISWGLAQLAKSFNGHRGIPIVTANQKKGDKPGKNKTEWQDTAFGKIVMHHASIGLGLGQNEEDKEAGRIRFDLFKNRDGERDLFFYMYPNFKVSKITSLKVLREFYGMDEE